MKDLRIALPALWIFMVLNYLYCDVVSLFDPITVRGVVAGQGAAGSFQITPEFLLASGVLMEIPIAMTMLSRVLRHRPARWANIGAAAFMAVVQIGSLGVGAPAAYYWFFSVIEVSTLVVIAWLAWVWVDPEPALSAA